MGPGEVVQACVNDSVALPSTTNVVVVEPSTSTVMVLPPATGWPAVSDTSTSTGTAPLLVSINPGTIWMSAAELDMMISDESRTIVDVAPQWPPVHSKPSNLPFFPS